MARRRFFRRAVRRSSYRTAPARRRSRSSSSGFDLMKTVLPAMAYGAGRQYVVNMIQPLTSKIPLGNYADEIALGTAGYFMAKKGNGIIKDAGKAILTIESASLGSQVVSGMTTQTSNSGYVYN